MKNVILLTFLLIFSLPLFATETLRFAGVYRDGSFRDKVPATIELKFEGDSVTAVIEAPAKSCVIRFAKGALTSISHRESGDRAWYLLPVIETCGRGKQFSNERKLFIERDRNGQLSEVQIYVTQAGGHVGWVYFDRE